MFEKPVIPEYVAEMNVDELHKIIGRQQGIIVLYQKTLLERAVEANELHTQNMELQTELAKLEDHCTYLSECLETK